VKIFVTGATGFIGQHLVRRIVEDGHQARCLARPTSDTSTLVGVDVEFVVGDVNDRAAITRGMAGCDWIFHLANLYSMWEPTPDAYWRINVDGTRLVMECALDAGMKRVIYVSTAAIYGKPLQSPFDEGAQPGRVLFSEYARSKAAADLIAWQMYRERCLPLVVLYPGIVLGAGDDKASGQYMQDILRRRVPSTIFHGSASTYVAVRDVVEALVSAAEAPSAVGQKYLIGNTVLTGKEFVQCIHEESGVKLPLFHFPDWMVTAAAYVLTMLTKFIHRPPLWGLSVDAAQTLRMGFQFSGRKAERELGLSYTPIHEAIAGAIASYDFPVPGRDQKRGRIR
jgi:dihydroflavonol-4-reductase